MSQDTPKPEPKKLDDAALSRKLQDITKEIQAVFERHECSGAVAVVECEGVVFEVDHYMTHPRKLGLLEFAAMGLRERLKGMFFAASMPQQPPPSKITRLR